MLNSVFRLLYNARIEWSQQYVLDRLDHVEFFVHLYENVICNGNFEQCWTLVNCFFCSVMSLLHHITKMYIKTSNQKCHKYWQKAKHNIHSFIQNGDIKIISVINDSNPNNKYIIKVGKHELTYIYLSYQNRYATQRM